MFKWLKRILTLAFFAIFLLVGVFFAIRNPQLIQLDLVFWQTPELSVALYQLLAFACGAVVALLASSIVVTRLNQRAKRLAKRVEFQKQELDSLRKATLTNGLAKTE
ncbi:LapA family protein [Maribrevibacterium harenarium]|uniref:LapA family protein n=1 Tax=Maribrevibacterium harenarium TaxID=2589817 RepID=A0A501WEK8_9GAMM|nr:LapA family protein [Maribrevibacterium harenarium]TPE48019.1 LapA family protein [Maribrevibacterium harenarium]